ncbi:MAG: DUF1080 domain-containing protein [Phycisphaerales bacterium]|nr:DUF1080 domain-containing protein [Phycisphaerales bacterium]
MTHRVSAALCALALTASSIGAPFPDESSRSDPLPLFNGKDLSGWVNVNCAQDTWSAKIGDDGLGYLACTGVPTGVLRTERMFENFILDLDWMHEAEPGNAGLFLWSDGIPAKGLPFTRSIEVQIMLTPDVHDSDGRLLYTGQGDMFAIHGSSMTPDRPHPAGWIRCLPSSRQTKGKGEWNHYTVRADQGRLTLAVNGVEVSGGSEINPRKGYICLESEGTPIRFRNIVLTPLPDAAPALAPSQCATDASGFVDLLNGSLSAWNEGAGASGHWTLDGTLLNYDGKGGDLWTKAAVADFELVVDWRWPAKATERVRRPLINRDGSTQIDASGKAMDIEVDEYDSGVFLRGYSKSQVNMWNWPIGSGEVYGYRTDPAASAELRAACTPTATADSPIGQWNRFLISMVGDRLWVTLNGVHVLPGATLPGVPASGPIGLQHHGSPLQFTNIFLRPLGPTPAQSP